MLEVQICHFITDEQIHQFPIVRQYCLKANFLVPNLQILVRFNMTQKHWRVALNWGQCSSQLQICQLTVSSM